MLAAEPNSSDDHKQNQDEWQYWGSAKFRRFREEACVNPIQSQPTGITPPMDQAPARHSKPR